MFRTSIGAFDGSSWEALCQRIFKLKYAADGYQAMPASPGDFGLEGFTLKTGYGFQCYCPDKHYGSKELYEAQRDKITADLNKLRRYEQDIESRIGSTTLGCWVFVTPEVDRNALLEHARSKEEEVRGWNLRILAPHFQILLHDAEFYAKEINEIRSSAGAAFNFDVTIPVLPPLDQSQEVYEANIRRKSACRLLAKQCLPSYQTLLHRLSQQSLKTFLEADSYFRRIEQSAPALYFRLVRLINEYENLVAETAMTWSGAAEELTSHIRDGLAKRISCELSPQVDETTASQVARHMVARWIAICQLDYV